MAKIDRSPMQRLFRGGCPKLELVTMAMATTAEVASQRHVHSKRATPMPRPGLVQRAASVRLRPDRFEGWNPDRLDTCSIVISVRTLSKSTLGTVLPRCVMRRLGG